MKSVNIEIPLELVKPLAEVMKGRDYPDEITEVYIIDKIGIGGIDQAERLYSKIINTLEKLANEQKATKTEKR